MRTRPSVLMKEENVYARVRLEITRIKAMDSDGNLTSPPVSLRTRKIARAVGRERERERERESHSRTFSIIAGDSEDYLV